MKLLAITHIYPNPLDETRGIYVKRELDEISKICACRIVVPIPFYKKIMSLFIRRNNQREGYKGRAIVNKNRGIYFPALWVIPVVGRSLNGFLYFFSILRSVYRIKKDFSPDLILCFWLYPDGFAAVLLSKVLRLPVVIKALGSDINTMPDSFVSRRILEWILKNSDAVISLSSDMTEKIKALGVDINKVKIISNGVDTTLFSPADKGVARRKLGIGSDKKIIIYVGRLSKEKGVNYLIEAMSMVKKKEPNVELLLTGSGPMEGELREMTRRLRLEGDIIFFGERPPEEIPLFMNASDLLCLPSLSEGCPNVILEAFTCGRPVVATKVGGIPDLIVSDDMGLMVSPRDAALLADALIKALNREWSEERISKVGSKRTWANVCEEMLIQFRKVIKEGDKYETEGIINTPQ